MAGSSERFRLPALGRYFLKGAFSGDTWGGSRASPDPAMEHTELRQSSEWPMASQFKEKEAAFQPLLGGACVSAESGEKEC